MIYLIIISSLLILVLALYVFKYTKLKRTIKHFYTYNRIGVAEVRSNYGVAQIHFEELEKYKNDLSKVKIIKIEYDTKDSSNIDSIKKRIYGIYYRDIVKTSDITWLERDEDLIAVRRKKLERLI